MQHFKHPDCNAVLAPAPGTENEVDPLHINCGQTSCGVPMVTSYWRPSEQDIANILAGGVVCLTVLGRTHPPLLLHVQP